MNNRRHTPAKLNIMIYAVDDDVIWRKYIEMALSECDTEGENAYKVYDNPNTMLEEWTPDVHMCIIDHCLIGPLTGLEVVKLVHKKNPICHTILLSSQTDMSVVKEALNLGVNNYVDKSDKHAFRDLCKYVQAGKNRMNAFTIKFKSLIDRQQGLDKKISDVTKPD